jgi:hypothetical protein
MSVESNASHEAFYNQIETPVIAPEADAIVTSTTDDDTSTTTTTTTTDWSDVLTPDLEPDYPDAFSYDTSSSPAVGFNLIDRDLDLTFNRSEDAASLFFTYHDVTYIIDLAHDPLHPDISTTSTSTSTDLGVL